MPNNSLLPKKNYYGYPVRTESPSEADYFYNNQNVSGMATEDGAIIFNPYSKGRNMDAVGKNEAARLWLREKKAVPEFSVTKEQREYFKGTAYENDELNMKHTILGRIISEDPSAGKITPEQKKWADYLKNELENR